MVDIRPSEDRRSWTEKYRPRTLDQLQGHIKAVQDIRAWASSWEDDKAPKKRALILEGEAGIGKTTAALALAREKGWEVIELNASDSRNLESIRKMATRGAMSRDITDVNGYLDSSSKKMKLILLDEADNLYERSASSGDGTDVGDRGGKRAIVELVKLTRQPVILIVNNLYGLTSGSGQTLNFTCEKIKFRRLASPSIAKRLRDICNNERIMFDEEVIKSIADRSSGDMRSAISDLQILCAGKERITVKDLDVLGFRDTKENIFNALSRVFRSRSLKTSRASLRDLDEDINTLLLWMAENTPSMISHPEDLDNAYYFISRSDIFLGRVNRRQNYKLWSYAKDMLAAVPLAKKHPSGGYSRFNFPSYLKSMSRTKDSRARLKETATELGKLTHTSIRYQKEDALYRIGLLCQRDPEFASSLLARTELKKEHLKLLTAGKVSEKEMRSIMDDAEAIRSSMAAPRELGQGLASFVNEEEDSREEPELETEIPVKEGKDDEAEKEPHQSSLFEF